MDKMIKTVPKIGIIAGCLSKKMLMWRYHISLPDTHTCSLLKDVSSFGLMYSYIGESDCTCVVNTVGFDRLHNILFGG